MKIKQEPVYYPDARAENAERPGEYPFTRGIHRDMYRGQLWTMRQYAGFGDAAHTNERFRYLLSQGQTGLSVAFDLPTQLGIDPDHPLACGEVGKVGVSIASIEDMEILMKDIPLDRVSVSMTINSTAAVLLSMLLCIARRRGVAWTLLRGTVQNDILKEYLARGTYIYPPAPSLKLATDIFEFCCHEVPKWNPISVSGYHIREAGASAVQEVAFTLADGIVYVEQARKAGLKIDEFAGKISFFFSCHNNFLEEIAKFRAARRLWAKIMKERFHANEPRSLALRFHTQTAGSTLTAQQPENNIVRVTLQALAAVLGGTQSLHTNALDEALALPSALAARTALRTQQIIAHESGVTNTVDPVGGSYAIEALTDEIEAGAADYIARIDDLGGMLRAIENGFIQREIQESAYRYQQSIESGEKVIVGVNRFVADGASGIELSKIDDQTEQQQRSSVQKLRSVRNSAKVEESLKRLRDAAGTKQNLLPSIYNAVESVATLGEISECLRGVFGEYRESVVL